MPVMAHLRELRRRIIVVVVIIAVGALFGWCFYDHIIAFLAKPYCAVPEEHRETVSGAGNAANRCVLGFNGPADGFIARLQISAMAGAVFTAPLWLYQIWAFITPGLRKNERKYTVIFVFLASILFAAGMGLAYLVLFPGLRVLIQGAGNHTAAMLFIKPYLSFVTTLMLIFGVAFELPLLIVMLNLVGVLPYRWLRRWQRVGIFLIFVFAGVATPTADPFTMCAMAVPMVLLFEGAVLFAYLHDKRKAARAAVEESLADPADDNTASTVNPLPERLERDESWSSLP